QHVHLAGETVVSWQVAASQGAPTARFNMTVSGADCNGAKVAGDSVEIVLPLKPPLTTETVATSGEVESGGTAVEHILLPYGTDPAAGGLTLAVAPSLAAGAAQGVQYL